MPAQKHHLPTPPSSVAPDNDADQPPATDPHLSPSPAASPQQQQVVKEEPWEEKMEVDGGDVGHDEEEMDADADMKPPSLPELQKSPPLVEQQVSEEEEEEKPFQREAVGQHLPKDDAEGELGGGGGDGGRSVEDDDDDDELVDELDDKQEFVQVKLADIRKEVQCPICLGIIRKTRTVMECLHRFCRECIDKSMRLGNNECPACRTHCASRRSLRDDPNYDALIAILYPDIDKYEEEELAFREEEQSRNKKIQAAIAETMRRQTEALGRKRSTAKATAEAFVRRSQGNYVSRGQNSYVRKRGESSSRENTHAASDDDDHDDGDLEANGNDGSKESSSADEPSPDRRQKRLKRSGAARPSPARAGSSDVGCEETNELEAIREYNRRSPLRAGNREMLAAWGKNGARSQTRHGGTSGSNGRMAKGGRMAKLVDYLRSVDGKEDEYDIHLNLISLDEESIPNLEQPYICCRPTLSIRHLCEFIAIQTCVQAEEVQLYAREPRDGMSSATNSPSSNEKCRSESFVGLKVLEEQESLAALCNSFITDQGEIVLEYSLKMTTQKMT